MTRLALEFFWEETYEKKIYRPVPVPKNPPCYARKNWWADSAEDTRADTDTGRPYPSLARSIAPVEWQLVPPPVLHSAAPISGERFRSQTTHCPLQHTP